MPVRIKICGMTRYEDARVACNLGVDALGFIFHPKSKRFITPEQAREIIRKLPPYVSRVGVFVDTPTDDVISVARYCQLDTIQLHGNESPEFCEGIPYPVVKTIAIGPETSLAILDQYSPSGFLLDTWSNSGSGGTGKTFDWRIAAKACQTRSNVILAGGLGPSNILDALNTVKPYGIDLNSGVEISPGIKNPLKMRDCVNLVRSWKDQ